MTFKIALNYLIIQLLALSVGAGVGLASDHKNDKDVNPTNSDDFACNSILDFSSQTTTHQTIPDNKIIDFFKKTVGLEAHEELDFNWRLTQEFFETPGTPENQIVQFITSQVGKLIDEPEWTRIINEGGEIFQETEALRAQIYLETKLPSWKSEYSKTAGSVVNPNTSEEKRKQQWNLWIKQKHGELVNLELSAKSKLAEHVYHFEAIRRARADKFYTALSYLAWNPQSLSLVLAELPSSQIREFRFDLALPFLLMYLLIEDANLLHPEPTMETSRFVRFDYFESELENVYFLRLKSLYPEMSQEQMYNKLKKELRGLSQVQLNFGLYSSRRQSADEYFSKKFFQALLKQSYGSNSTDLTQENNYEYKKIGYKVLNRSLSLPVADPFLNLDEESLGGGTFTPTDFGSKEL